MTRTTRKKKDATCDINGKSKTDIVFNRVRYDWWCGGCGVYFDYSHEAYNHGFTKRERKDFK